VRGLLPPEACEALRMAFKQEVVPSRDYFLRHASGIPERHVFTEHGYMRYPLMNLQDLPNQKYPRFRRHGLDALTHPNIQQVIAALYGGPGKLMHTMYFEGNQVTWAHQDSYYIDSEEFGRMVGAWIALEDIQPGAGRFYVCPGSHRLTLPGGQLPDPNRQAYKDQVIRMIAENALECRAPALRKGDGVFWSGNTIHGSLPTLTPEYSRSSITAHYIPADQQLLWFRSQVAKLKSQEVNGMLVHFHHDLDDWHNRVLFQLRGRFPGAYKLAWQGYQQVRGLIRPARLPQMS
jgi:phytanoyl-CoA hydroxylase